MDIKYYFSNDVNEEKQKKIKIEILKWIEEDKDYLELNETNIVIDLKWDNPLNSKLNGNIKNKDNKILINFNCDEHFKKFEYTFH
jgi:Zn-dependent peptidase ImmA (M78 family)